MYQDNSFNVCVQLNFYQRQTYCIDDQDKVQSVTDTNNEFTECQNTKEKAPINLHFPCQLTRIYENFKQCISEVYKVQVDCLKHSGSDSYDKNAMEVKVNSLVRLHKAMQEKLKTVSYSEQVQILTLVPNKWCRMHSSEYFNIFEYLL